MRDPVAILIGTPERTREVRRELMQAGLDVAEPTGSLLPIRKALVAGVDRPVVIVLDLDETGPPARRRTSEEVQALVADRRSLDSLVGVVGFGAVTDRDWPACDVLGSEPNMVASLARQCVDVNAYERDRRARGQRGEARDGMDSA